MQGDDKAYKSLNKLYRVACLYMREGGFKNTSRSYDRSHLSLDDEAAYMTKVYSLLIAAARVGVLDLPHMTKTGLLGATYNIPKREKEQEGYIRPELERIENAKQSLLHLKRRIRVIQHLINNPEQRKGHRHLGLYERVSAHYATSGSILQANTLK